MKFQIGKFGVTEGILESLRLAFKKHKIVRISVLKSAERDRSRIKEIGESLANGLRTKEHEFVYRIIGFTIILRKVSKERRASKIRQ